MMSTRDSKAFFDNVVYFNDTEYINQVIPVNLDQAEYTGKDVLDYGCGCGDAALYFAKHSAGRVVGIDIGRENISHAREGGKALTNVDFIEADLREFALDKSAFDVIWSDTVIELLGIPIPEIIDRFKSALRPSGILYVSFLERNTFNRVLYFFLRILKMPGLRWGFVWFKGLVWLRYKIAGVRIDPENLKNKLAYLEVPEVRLVDPDSIVAIVQQAGFTVKYCRPRVKSDPNSPPHVELKAVLL